MFASFKVGVRLNRSLLLTTLLLIHGFASDAFAMDTATKNTEPNSACYLRERRLTAMGTELYLEVIGPNPVVLEKAMDAAVQAFGKVEDLMTDWRDSELLQLNRAAGTGPHPVPVELAQIIARALELHSITYQAFDVTYAAVGRLWKFKEDPPKIPDQASVNEALAFVDASKVHVEPSIPTVDLPNNMTIGLGGIAKGYGVDQAMNVLMKYGIKHAMVNAGGDLKVLGKKNDQLREIAIKHPRQREKAMAVLKLSNASVVTSGDYERFFEYKGKRYHHIIDPRNGYPAEGCMSSTVVAPSAEYGDALATALCVLGPAKGLELVEGLPRVEAILVGFDGEVHVSTGLTDTIR